jgi:catechol 2,3-dioxygenase-like lactoylglutathione lyase family enzyme
MNLQACWCAMVIGTLAISTVARSAEPPPAPIIKMGGVGLNVSDTERSKSFYKDVLMMKVAFVAPMGDKGSEVVMSMSGKMGQGDPFIVLAHGGSPPGAGKESFGRVIINTTDAVGIANRASAGGYKVSKMPVPGRDVYFISDPDGYQIEVYGATLAELTGHQP